MDGKIAFGFWYNTIQGDRGMDLPSLVPTVLIPAGQTKQVLVRLRRDCSYIFRSIKMFARDLAGFQQDSALHFFTDDLVITPFVDGGDGNKALGKPIVYSTLSTARPGRGQIHFNYALPARSIVTLSITNQGSSDLNVGGTMLGIAIKLKG